MGGFKMNRDIKAIYKFYFKPALGFSINSIKVKKHNSQCRFYIERIFSDDIVELDVSNEYELNLKYPSLSIKNSFIR